MRPFEMTVEEQRAENQRKAAWLKAHAPQSAVGREKFLQYRSEMVSKGLPLPSEPEVNRGYRRKFKHS